MPKLFSSKRGIATTEFALISPLLFVIICGFIELAWVESARSALESAVMKAARKIAATDCPAQRQTILTDTVVRGMQHIASSDGSLPQITAKSYSSDFGDVGEPEPFTDVNHNGQYDAGEPYTDVNGNGQWDSDMGKSGAGDANQVVSYTATFKVKSLVPWIATRFNNGSTEYPISATTVIRNEPVFRSTGCP